MSDEKIRLFLTLRAKLIIIFITLIAAPFMISGFLTYRNYTKSVEESSKVSSNQLAAQISKNLDNYLNEIDRLTLLPFYESKVLDILKNHISPRQKVDYIPTNEYLTMNLFLSSISFNRSEIRGIFLLANDGVIFSNLNETSYINHKGNDNWREISHEGQYPILIAPPHLPEYYLNNTDKVFSVMRSIRDPYDSKFLGIIKIDLTKEAFDKVITSDILKNNKIHLIDQKGNIFYPSNEKEQKISITLDNKVRINNTNFITSSKTSDYSGLNVIALLDENTFKKDAIELINSTAIISVVCLFMAILIAVFFSDRIVRPVKHLQKKMKSVQTGNFDERAEVYSRDEIGSLSQGFNVMVSQLDKLVKEVYETKLRERDAELSALQSQINPHFLYNTLELVNMMAIENNQFEISDIISSLGRLLRYTVDKKEKPVYLKEEIRFIQAYLTILKSRYGERLKTEVTIDPSLEYCLVPKLIIQPLVENAVLHGINENKGKITIKASQSEETLILSVKDNGIGIDQSSLEFLEKKIFGSESYNTDMETFGVERKGYALRNVHQRIRLLYGNEYGLSIDNTLKQGCEFIIKLPIIFSASREPIR